MTVTDERLTVDSAQVGQLYRVTVWDTSRLPIKYRSDVSHVCLRLIGGWLLVWPQTEGDEEEVGFVIRRGHTTNGWSHLEGLRGHYLGQDNISGITDMPQSLGQIVRAELPITDLDGNRERIAALIQEKTTLELRVETAERLERQVRAELERAKATHKQDIERIGERLLEEAESRDWCGDYDEIIDGLNGRLTVRLPERTKRWVALVDVTLRVRVEVDATNEDTADEAARRKDWPSVIYGLSGDDIDVQETECYSVEEAD